MKEMAMTDGEGFRKKKKRRKKEEGVHTKLPTGVISFFLWSSNSRLALVTFHTEGLVFVIGVLGRKWSGCGLQRWREGFE